MQLKHAGLALIGGAAVPFAFAPYNFFWVIFPAIALLFLLWERASSGEAAALGAIFGLGMFGHGVSWVQVSVHQFGLPLYSFSVTVTVGFILILCVYPAVCGYVLARTRDFSLPVRMLLLFPAAWTISELLRGWLFTGFPWLLLGYSQVDSPLAAYAPLLGVTGISLACALVAGCLVMAVRGTRRERVLTAVILVALVLGGIALDRHAFTRAVGKPQAVALIQGAIPQAVKWNREYREASIELYSSLSEPHWGKFLILWPETAIAAFAQEVPDVMTRLSARARSSGTALLVGMPAGDPAADGRYYNSVVQLGAETGRYDKRHLVPFGEYLPFDQWIRPVLTFLRIPMSSFTPGAEKQPLMTANGWVLGISICYEDAYSGEVARALPQANVLINVSNDAWFGKSIAPHQHLQIARMRALETGRYLLRATNTGISAIIDERGKVVARSRQFVPDVVIGAMIPRAGMTPAARYGVWIPLMLCLAMIATGVLAAGRIRVS